MSGVSSARELSRSSERERAGGGHLRFRCLALQLAALTANPFQLLLAVLGAVSLFHHLGLRVAQLLEALLKLDLQIALLRWCLRPEDASKLRRSMPEQIEARLVQFCQQFLRSRLVRLRLFLNRSEALPVPGCLLRCFLQGLQYVLDLTFHFALPRRCLRPQKRQRALGGARAEIRGRDQTPRRPRVLLPFEGPLRLGLRALKLRFQLFHATLLRFCVLLELETALLLLFNRSARIRERVLHLLQMSLYQCLARAEPPVKPWEGSARESRFGLLSLDFHLGLQLQNLPPLRLGGLLPLHAALLLVLQHFPRFLQLHTKYFQACLHLVFFCFCMCSRAADRLNAIHSRTSTTGGMGRPSRSTQACNTRGANLFDEYHG
mmetsp:Transcript_38101/g.104884  ORF Transcript_38101/g.104884 Transcript_38101/m.104884 type:complete len:377 (-) Transcript_38101:26-1156(-)